MDPPTIDPAAVHYLSGEYRLSAPGGTTRSSQMRLDYIDLGPVPDRPLGPYETPPTVPARHDLVPSGLSNDPGAPAVDAARSAQLTVVPVAGWGTTGPATTTPIQLLPRFISFAKNVIQAVRETPPWQTKDPDTFTWPAVQIWEVGNGYAPHHGNNWAGPAVSPATPGGAQGVTVQQRHTYNGLANATMLEARPGPGRYRTVARSGPAGSGFWLNFTVGGGHIVGFEGINIGQPDNTPRAYEITMLDHHRATPVVWSGNFSTFGRASGDGAPYGRPWFGNQAIGPYDQLNIDAAGVRALGPDLRMFTFFLGLRVQPDPIRNVGATHLFNGKYWPQLVQYQPAENKP